MSVYSNERCKETLYQLKYEYSLPDILKLHEFFSIQSAYKQEQHEEMKKQQQRR